MKLKREELTLGQEDIFENDLMHRKDEVKNLSQIIIQVEDPLVLAINAPWGSGKTTLIKLLQANLEKEHNSAVININAWETDFAEDPLIPILNSIDMWASRQSGPVKASAKRLLKSAAPILKQSFLASLKIATLGAVTEEGVAEVMADLSESYGLKALSYFEQSKDSVSELKDSIQALQKDVEGNLIIFIDELDRCRPNYAIELLERVKHLFSIDGVVFVLSIDQAQLAESIKSVYGSNFRSDTYLKRFIDLSYTPKNDIARDYIRGLLSDEFFEKIQKEGQLSNLSMNTIEPITEPFEQLFYTLECSLRDVNQIVMEFKLVLMSVPKEEHRLPLITLFLIILRKMKPELYNDFLSSNGEEIINKVITDIINQAGISKRISTVMEALIYRVKYDKHERNPGAIDKYLRIRNETFVEDALKREADLFLQVFWDCDNDTIDGPLQQVLRRRIEFGSSLVTHNSLH